MRERLALLVRRHAGFVAVCGLLFGGFEFLIAMAVARLELGGTLGSLVTILPPAMRVVLETTFSGDFTARGLQAFGWTHPISHAVGAAIAVILATRAIAGACEDGTIETLLALPLTRRRYLAAESVFALLALAAAALAGALGTAAGQRAFGLARIALFGDIVTFEYQRLPT